MRKIHIRMLVGNDPYCPSIRKFRELFGESVEPTLDLCLIYAVTFSNDWCRLSKTLLTKSAFREFKADVDLAISNFLEQKGLLFLEFQKDTQHILPGNRSTSLDYKKLLDKLWINYEELRRLRRVNVALAFYTAYSKETIGAYLKHFFLLLRSRFRPLPPL